MARKTGQNGHLGRRKLGHWFYVMRKLWIYDLGSWKITGRKWQSVKVGYLDFANWNNDWKAILANGINLEKCAYGFVITYKLVDLEYFLDDNTRVQSIWLHQSRIRNYDVSNRGTKQSANVDTNKKMEIVFGIRFKNWTKGFVISWNLKHKKSLTSKMQHKRNFKILVNWVKVITHQTWLPII